MLGAGVAAPLQPLSAFSTPNAIAQHLLQNPAIAFRQHPLFTPPPDERLFSVRVSDDISLRYTQREFAGFLRDLQVHDIHAARANGNKERRKTHPDVAGLEVKSIGNFLYGAEHDADRVIWSVREGLPSTVFLENDGVALIDAEVASAQLLVGLGNARESSRTILVRGALNGRKTILAVHPEFRGYDLGYLYEWFQKNAFVPDEVVVVGGRGKNWDVDEEEEKEDLMRSSEDSTIAIKFHEASVVMVGTEGYSLGTNDRFEHVAWEGMQPLAAVDASPALESDVGVGVMLKSSVEGVIQEFVTQDGLIALTKDQLARIFEGVGKNQSLHQLRSLFEQGFHDDKIFEGFGTREELERLKLEMWGHAFTLFAAPDVMAVLKPRFAGDERIGRFNSYYYAFSRIVRTTNSRQSYRVRPFLWELLNHLKEAGLVVDKDADFLSTMIHEGLSDNFDRYDGIGDHDTHVCVQHMFGRFSAFPFRFLANRLSLLSIVGGYGRDSNEPVLRLLRKWGWRGLVIAEYLRGDSGGRRSGAVDGYGKSAALAEKYGFEPIGEVMSLNESSYRSSASYLLPASEHLIKGREDLDIHDEGSLISGFVQEYQRLLGKCADACYCLKPLARFINSREDLDPTRKGSLGSLLIDIHERVKESDAHGGIFMFGIPAIAHLITDISELDPGQKDSIASILIAKSSAFDTYGRDAVRWADVAKIFPLLRSKAELVDLLDSVPFWNDYLANFNTLTELLNEEPAWREEKRALDRDVVGRVVLKIVQSKRPVFTPLFSSASAAKSLVRDRYRPLREFVADESVDINVRINVLADYSELLQLDDELNPSDGWGRHRLMDREAASALDPLLDAVAGEVNAIIEEYRNAAPDKRVQRSRLHARISKKLNSLRYSLVSHVLGREITEAESRLVSEGQGYMRILRLVSLAYTIEGGDGFRQGALAREIVKGALNVLFANYDPKAKGGEQAAVDAMNRWLYSLGKEDVTALYLAADPYENEGRARHEAEAVQGNQALKTQLVSKGYDERLWEGGVDLQVRLSEGLTEEDKREQIRTATFELVEIALLLGVEKFKGKKLTLDLAQELDSYEKASDFVREVRQGAHRISDELSQRLRLILEAVEDMQQQVVSPDVAAATFRATVKKDLFTEAYAGVGVPGCFNPRGVHREMPFVHATEANSGFMQVFNGRGDQVANAVVVYSDDGAYVYPGFNSSAYNMDRVYAEAIKDLSRYVPAVYMNSASAGLNSLKQYATKVEKKLVVPPAIITDRYYDLGNVGEDGNLTIEQEFYVVTEESIRRGGGFEKRLIHAEASDDMPEIRWQALADQFLSPNFERYPFLAKLEDPKALLRTMTAVKSAFLAGGWQVADDGLYDEIGAIVAGKVGDVDMEVKDGVTDMVIDFLAAQNWPMEHSSGI